MKLKYLHDISDVHEKIMYMVACLLMENNIQQKSISSNRFFVNKIFFDALSQNLDSVESDVLSIKEIFSKWV